MNQIASTSAKENRLIAKGDIGQFGRDLADFHLRTDGVAETAGSLIMAPVVGITKIGNAVAGEFSSVPATPLGDGGLKYTIRDARSAISNIFAAGKNLLTLHPLRAAGNLVKAGFDGVDLAIDPLLDIGSGIFGHQHRTRHSVKKIFAF